ncbi:MAG: alpha/beta fold hydrolase [bacterium]
MLQVATFSLKRSLSPLSPGSEWQRRLPVSAGLLFIWLVALLVCLPPTTGTAAPAPEQPAETSGPATVAELLVRLSQQMRADELALARETALDCLELQPDFPVMQYNLACIEARLDHDDDAWDALTTAFRCGFSDLRLAAADPDLERFHQTVPFDSLLAACRERLLGNLEAQAFSLDEGGWSDEFTLTPNDGSAGDNSWPEVTTTVRFDKDGLEIAAEVSATDFRDRPLPWHNGDGFLVNLVVLPDDGGYESEYHFSFGFGLEAGSPCGAVVARHGVPTLQRVVELAPKIKLSPTGDTASYTMWIPWRSCAVLAPPLLENLGLNICYLRVDEEGLRRRVSLVADPLIGSGGAPWRRFVRVGLALGPESPPQLRGRLSDAVVGSEPLVTDMVVWSPTAGSGTLLLEVLDISGRSVVQGGARAEAIEITAGRNVWQRPADLSALPVGPFRLVASVILPSGEELGWEAALLRYDSEWPATLAERRQVVPESEQLALDVRLDAIAEALDNRFPADDPSPISTTLVELGLMVQHAEQTGSVLTANSSPVLACEDPYGDPVQFSLHLPESFTLDVPQRLLVLLTDAGLADAQFVTRVGEALADQEDLVVLMPRLDVQPGQRSELAILAAREAIDWAQARFQSGPVQLVGLDSGGATALRISLLYPERCKRVLLAAADGFHLWPLRKLYEISSLFEDRLNSLPYTLIRFPAARAESSPAAHMVTAMTEIGFQLQEVELSPDQLAGPVRFDQDLIVQLLQEWVAR